MGYFQKFEPDVNHVKNRLKHYFRFDHLSSEQGIAILIGLEIEDEYIDLVSNWGNCADELKLIESGIRLLNGDVIGGDPLDEIPFGEPISVQYSSIVTFRH